MSKIVQMILAGIFFTFIADFFLFLALKLHYINPLGIDVYYNILFADNQNFFLYAVLSLIVGTLIIYTDKKIYLSVMTLFYLGVAITLYPPVGKTVGEMLFMKKDVLLHNKKFTFRGDILYTGRDKIYFFDKDLNKMIELKKTEIQERIDD